MMDEIEMEMLRFRSKTLSAVRNEERQNAYKLIISALDTSVEALNRIRLRNYPRFEAVTLADLTLMTRKTEALRIILATLD